jgi:hypothetical protein
MKFELLVETWQLVVHRSNILISFPLLPMVTPFIDLGLFLSLEELYLDFK